MLAYAIGSVYVSDSHMEAQVANRPAYEDGPPARRVLKVLADAGLIRRMDALILSSRGGYADRSEFVAEALRDRIEAEEELQGADPTHPETRAAAALEVQPTPMPTPTNSFPPIDEWRFGDWLDRSVPTLPPTTPVDTENYGLHNRDLPTFLALDVLGGLTVQTGGPVPWSEFVNVAAATAWTFGETMAAADLSRPTGLKRSAGFPLNRKKPDAAETRFRDHAIGTLGRAPRGPVFVFGMVGLSNETREPTVALSPAGFQLLKRLSRCNLESGPPFEPAAWASFSEHLAAHAPDELRIWRSVLAATADGPTRRELVSRCDQWSGSVADTNVMGYVARGREWGLVELTLDAGRYGLTELGHLETANREDQK